MKRFATITATALLTVLSLAACNAATTPPLPNFDGLPAGERVPTGAESSMTDSVTALPPEDNSISSSPATESSEGGSVPALTASDIVTNSEPPPFSTRNWSTDFSVRSVEWNEILSGGPPKDGIPAVDVPRYESIESASEWLTEQEPVIVFEHDGMARAYPLSILIWHEIVNDEIAGTSIAVTFCPLCNASIVFDRRLYGATSTQELDFGTTGKLRKSDLIMYDRQTETWWQQFTGEAIVGELTGRQLRFLPSQVLGYGDFVKMYPEGQVLARPVRNGRFLRNYGNNPYVGYDSSSRPFLFDGSPDDRLPATERVAGITTENTAKAYSFSDLADAGVINDTFEDMPVALFHSAGVASALDSSTISEGRDVGTVAVYERRIYGRTLSFSTDDAGNIVDEETGTVWNILGEGVDGPLAGEELTPVLHFDHFWFAWAAFFPDTSLYAE